MTDSAIADFRRREYPEFDAVFLNSASYGLLPRSTTDAVTSLTRRRNRPLGVPDAEPGAALRRARRAAGRLLDVPSREIALVPNTTFGIQLAANLVGAGPPGRIVVSAGEFPANVLPWLALESRGFTVDVVALREDRPDEDAMVARLSSGDVRAVSISAVQYASGVRADLARMGAACRRAGALFVVDAIQALGTVPLAPRELGIDVLATGGQKWLLAPWGSGFAWVAPHRWEHLPPPVVSWLAVEGGTSYTTRNGYALDYLGDARRFEPATLGVQDYLGLAVSLETLLELGLERIRAHHLAVQRPLVEWAEGREGVRLVTPVEEARRGGIVALDTRDPEGALRALENAGVRAAVRDGFLRFAPHVYVSVDEMERTVEVLDAWMVGD
ncbi:MAG: aminotransferase class V-fold PLP-dependent enzyme [Gemmatimonadetes bacterium]|nr:aminotransferase class V-fold PLP-dependent enzyme [Gemmatimonadota bacterium]MBT8405733.1 aminotransferase class V-fold PLP-dependent enzyme [Gemmatimonadota bacterium]NNK61568.1 aminotransferase class V-fold PLP-dependent enzyme [Gemmatimonadota bacterium]